MINLLRPLIPVLTLGVLTAPASAFEPTACLQAPNQTCVFELALHQAAQERFVTDLAAGFFRVAAQQELAGSDAYLDTLARFEEAMLQAEWRPELRGRDLSRATAGIHLLARDGAPLETERLIDAYVEGHERTRIYERRPDYPFLRSVKDAAESGDVELVHDLLTEGPQAVLSENVRAAVTIFMRQNNFEAALGLAVFQPTPEFIDDVNQGIIVSLLLDEGLAVAEAYADTLEAETTRQWAAGYLALDAAETGAFDEAIRLIQRPELRRLDAEDEWFIRMVAETYARLGRADIAEGLTAQIRPDIADYGTTGNVLNIAYAVAGEHEKFADRLRHQSPGDIESHVRWAIVAALNAGQHDMLRFLSAMPLEHQTAAHIGYGQALLDHDRFDEALDLYHLIAPHYLTEEAPKARGRGLPQRIALELADRGRMDEALEIVAPLGPSWVTADIAAIMN